MSTDRKSLRKWIKKENRNTKLVIHMACLLMIVAVAVMLPDIHMLMASLPMFAQEGGDFMESL